MKYLIICSYYPPDSAISAVRPYMFAKYLSRFGNRVTVLRSGAFNSTPDGSYDPLENVRVVSFLGDRSDAERYARGEYSSPARQTRKAETDGALREIAKKAYHILREPVFTRNRLKKAKANFELQKAAIDSLQEDFDVVISTYSELENIFAGAYAAGHFHAKWIVDFRDSIVDHINRERFVWNAFARRYQRYALKTADLCTTVSNGLTEELGVLSKKTPVQTLYNGYDEEEACVKSPEHGKKLRICYTGQVYDLRLSALKHLVAALRQLVDSGRIRKNQLSFVYAGRNSASVAQLFSEYLLEDLLEDHGQVARAEALALQDSSDVFLVLSWNTRNAKGILTGKFYEGIRAEKPIIAIVEGNVPESELKSLEGRYRYGFCYEACEKRASVSELADYIFGLCSEKASSGELSYHPSPALKDAFMYKTIVKRLDDLAQRLFEKE